MTQAPVRTEPKTTPAGPYVGRPMDRVDGVAKTTGEAKFSAEYPYPDIAHAALVHAPIARGRITGVDSAAALAARGVLAVITHENAPAMKPSPSASMLNMETWRCPAR